MSKKIAPRDVWFALFCMFSLVVFWHPLRTLVDLSRSSAYHSHIVLIPLVAAYLTYRERKRIFSTVAYDSSVANILLLTAVLLFGLNETRLLSLSESGYLLLSIVSIVVLWIGGFALCYGAQAFRAALFPLLLLFLIAPVPIPSMEKFMSVVRAGSAEVASAVFSMTGIPVFREGFFFSLPGLVIEIAEQCSGIHSTIALFIISLIAGHLFLRASWKKVALILFVFPIISLTNGLRIVTVTLLAVYVDRSFLVGNLHRNGGIFFFLMALALLTLILHFFSRREKAAGSESAQLQG